MLRRANIIPGSRGHVPALRAGVSMSQLGMRRPLPQAFRAG